MCSSVKPTHAGWKWCLSPRRTMSAVTRSFLPVAKVTALIACAAAVFSSATAVQAQTPGDPIVVPHPGTGAWSLFSVAANGLERQTFNPQTGQWSAWQQLPNQTGVNASNWDSSLVGLSWMDFIGNRSRMLLFNAVNNRTLATTFGENPLVSAQPFSFNVALDATPAPGFFPKTVFTQMMGQMNLWGTEKPAHHLYLPASNSDVVRFGLPARQLQERFWDGGSWRFTAHGASGGEFLLGPLSSVWVEHGNDDVGFVLTVEDTFSSHLWLTTRVWEPASFSWRWGTIGLPETWTHARPPILVPYQRNGETKIRMFIVALQNPGRVAGNGSWRLFSMERNENGEWVNDRGERRIMSDLRAWNDHGVAPGVSGLPRDANGLPSGFDLNAKIVWRDDANQQRVNLFGHSDRGEALPNLWYNGAIWQWSATVTTPVAGTQMRCGSIGFVRRTNTSNRYRVSAFVRLSNGQIWERLFDTSTTSSWTWERRR